MLRALLRGASATHTSLPLAAGRAVFCTAPHLGGRLAFDADVSPGSSLNVALRGIPADVAVAAGPLYSAHVEATWSAAGSSGRPPLAVALEGETVTVRLADDCAADGAALLRGMRVQAKTPPRFFSVAVETGGRARTGSVSVDTVVEGSVRIASGGAVTVTRSRGGDLVIRCSGPATVGEAAAQTDIESNGGDVRITRLAGRDVRIVSGGGSVHVGSAFCERLRIDSSRVPSASGAAAAAEGGGRRRGGEVTVGSLRVEETAEISTGGGAVTLWGLDGSGAERTAVRSGGGRVEAQLHERANALSIDSQGGAVSLFVPETFSRAVAVAGALRCATPTGARLDPATGRVDLRGGATGASPPPQRVLGGSDDHAGAAMAAPPEGEVRVDAGGGAVELRRLSWMEQTMRKMQAANATGGGGGGGAGIAAPAGGTRGGGRSKGGAAPAAALGDAAASAKECRMHSAAEQ